MRVGIQEVSYFDVKLVFCASHTIVSTEFTMFPATRIRRNWNDVQFKLDDCQ